MHSIRLPILAASLATCSLCSAALPPEDKIQGLYEGTWKDAEGAVQAESRLVAMGNNSFKLLVRREVGGTIERAELDGTIEGDTLAFKNSDGLPAAKATFADGGIEGAIGENATLALKPATRTSPTLGKKAPEGAVILIDGKNFENMKPNGGEWGPVDENDGSIQVPRGGMNSVPQFDGSFDAHVEFLCPLQPAARSQGRGNSGCYLPCGQEVQVLDSFGMTTYLGGGCGGLYGKKDPDTMEPIPSLAGNKENVFNLTSLPPLQWQTYDIEYRVTRNDAGKATGALTVYHNGVKIHDAVELNHKAGGFHFQDHGNPVRYRNIWVLKK